MLQHVISYVRLRGSLFRVSVTTLSLTFLYLLSWAIIPSSRLPRLLMPCGPSSFPFVNLIQYKDFRFHNVANCGFVLSSPFKSIKMNMEDLQFSVGRQYGHPSCLYRRQNVVLTNPQIHSTFFSSFCESFSLLIVFFPCMKMQLCGCQSQSVFEQLACPGPVPDGLLFFFSFPASLYTCDEQVVASEQTPALKSLEWRRQGTRMEVDMMLYEI